MSKGAWKDDVHIFGYEGSQILYQVQTGVFFKIDRLVREILSFPEDAGKEDITAELSPRYGWDEVSGALEELEAMDILRFAPALPIVDVDTSEGRGSRAPLLITMTLHVSHACNIKCSYCFALGGNYGGKSELMEPATACQAIDWLLQESIEAGRCHVDFFGGEPLLNLDLIKEAVHYGRAEAAKKDIEISFAMTTNGTLLSGEALEFIMQEDIGILVSVDGKKQDHDRNRTFHNGDATYDVIAENVRNATEQRPDLVVLRSTMTSQNLDMEEIADSLSGFGANLVMIAPVTEAPSSPTAIREEHLPELKRHLKKLSKKELIALIENQETDFSHFKSKIKQILTPRKKEYGCGGGKTFFGVSTDGSIYFCSSFASQPDYKMGDVFNGLDPEKQTRFNRDLYVDNREPCNTCWARYLCGGGCIYTAQMANGKSLTPNPVTCEQIRYTYELAMGMCMELQEQQPQVLESLAQSGAHGC